MWSYELQKTTVSQEGPRIVVKKETRSWKWLSPCLRLVQVLPLDGTSQHFWNIQSAWPLCWHSRVCDDSLPSLWGACGPVLEISHISAGQDRICKVWLQGTRKDGGGGRRIGPMVVTGEGVWGGKSSVIGLFALRKAFLSMGGNLCRVENSESRG